MRTVLHYLGYDRDAGGIVSAIRALAGAEEFACVLGVNPGFEQRRVPPLPCLELPGLAGERIGWRETWRARRVAAHAAAWLREDPRRIFHAHSRAGLLAALWLRRWGETRVVASVHCYGRQRWFYRWAARRLGGRLFWLSPAMKRHYGVTPAEDWTQCIPGCVPPPEGVPRRGPRPGGTLHLGGVGALVPWKRWDLVGPALAALPAPLQARVRFSHIGEPDTTAAARRLAETLRTAAGAASRVEWRGGRPSATEFLAEIDCLLVASDREPFSIALLEALAAGVPVLAADSGGTVDIVEPGRNGWLFRSGSAPDLARQLAHLLQTDALARVQPDPARLRRFTAPEVAAQWRRVYERCSEPTASSARFKAER